MRALVTGAAGFVGRHLVRELVEGGWHVTALVRPAAQAPPQLDHPRVDLLRADMRRLPPDLASRLPEFAQVFHLAVASRGTIRDRFDASVLGTERLLDGLDRTRWRGRLVHVSSMAVYAFEDVPAGATIDESTPLEERLGRRGEYCWIKGWQERLVRDFAAGCAAEVVIVRPGEIYGAERRMLSRVGRQVGSRLLLLGGLSVLPLTYVENTVSLLAECGRHAAAAGEVFNAVDPEPVRQWRYANAWRRCAAEPVTVVPVPLALLSAIRWSLVLSGRHPRGAAWAPAILDADAVTAGYKRFRYDGTKAARLLGWTPPVPLDEALRRTFGGPSVPGRPRPFSAPIRPGSRAAGWPRRRTRSTART